jgi:hypothetical protein
MTRNREWRSDTTRYQWGTHFPRCRVVFVWEIPDIRPLCCDTLALYELNRELKKLSGEEVEIIYDRSTTLDATMPAWHVYRIDRPGGTPGDDGLVLEFSLKRDMSKAWSPENAKEPGPWVLRYYASTDKKRMSGPSEEWIDEHLVAQAFDRHDKLMDDSIKEQAEAQAELAKEVYKYAGKNKNDLGKRMARKAKRGPKSKKASSYNGQNARG